jgi:response regulator RpfG family c-di-GMP phosphodiesterase
MQQTSRQSAGRTGTPKPRTESPDEKIQEPLKVTQEAIDAYEKRTGFHGIGRIMVEDGHWIIVTQEELARSRAPTNTNRIALARQRGIA